VVTLTPAGPAPHTPRRGLVACSARRHRTHPHRRTLVRARQASRLNGTEPQRLSWAAAGNIPAAGSLQSSARRKGKKKKKREREEEEEPRPLLAPRRASPTGAQRDAMGDFTSLGAPNRGLVRFLKKKKNPWARYFYVVTGRHRSYYTDLGVWVAAR
jgi:hypothetical protein